MWYHLAILKGEHFKLVFRALTLFQCWHALKKKIKEEIFHSFWEKRQQKTPKPQQYFFFLILLLLL